MSVAPAVGDRAVTEGTAGRGRVLGKATSVLGTLITVVLVAVAALVVLLAAATRLSGRQQASAFGHPILIVLSGSMAPAIRTGDLVVDRSVTPAGAARLHVGQIATFRVAAGSAATVNHRIVRVVRRGGGVFYETRGDANAAPDASLRPSSDVVGVDEWTIPRGGYFLTNIRRPFVLGLLLAAPLLWLLAGMLRRRSSRPATSPGDALSTRRRRRR